METRQSKRQRTQQGEQRMSSETEQCREQPEDCGTSTSTLGTEAGNTDHSSGVDLSLQVKWSSGAGTDSDVHGVKTRISRLSLKHLENIDKLGGLSKGLMDRAFSAESRPDYLTDNNYYRWTPEETCLSYPLDVNRTEFKLVAMYNGWEYVILSHELGNRSELQDGKLFVTVIEFESVAVVLGNLGIRISLVAYPVICVQKSFLDDIKNQIKTNPHFKGILT